MPIGEKNQVMKYANKSVMTAGLTKWQNCLLPGLMLTIFFGGCTVMPTKKLVVEDISRSFGEGAIISTRLGQAVTFEDLLDDLDSCQITYVGEKHTNIAHHKIQLQIIQAVYKNHPNIAVGMEMFDHTYQDVLDLWSAGKLDERTFLRKVHWYANWRYDFSLYRDILEFIKEHNIRLVGLNIPNHIPPKIREGGIENLNDEEKAHLPQQIDMSNSAHRDYLQKIFEGHQHHFKSEVEFDDFYAAQSVWEDAMAEMIAQSLNDAVMVVLAGNGHIQFKYGIPDRAYKQTGASFRTIYLEPVGSEVERDIADYIWVTE
jgi:uncharacterized iron-regulated protein